MKELQHRREGHPSEEAHDSSLPKDVFALALEQAMHPTAILNRQGDLVYTNRRFNRFAHLLRYHPSNLMVALQEMPPAIQKPFLECWQEIWQRPGTRISKAMVELDFPYTRSHAFSIQFLRLNEDFVLFNFIDMTRSIRSEMRYRRLLDTLNQRNVQLQATAEVAKSISRILNPQQLMNQTVQLIRKRFNAIYVGIYLVDEERGEAVLRAFAGESVEDLAQEAVRFPLDAPSSISWVITQAKARIYQGASLSKALSHPCEPEDGSELILPLISRGRCIGALAMYRAARRRVAGDLAILQTMADHLAVAIENARLFKEAQQELNARRQAEAMLLKRNRKLNLLNRANRTFISTLDPQYLLHNILLEVKHLLDVEMASIWLLDEAHQVIVCREAYGPDREIVRGWRLKVGQGLVGWVIQHRETVLVHNISADPRHYTAIDDLTHTIRSALTVPLQVQQRVIGALQVLDPRPHRFDQDDRTLLESIAITVAMAVENSRLYEQARQDATTKSILLREVNHRVKNNLMAIIGLIYAEERHAREGDQSALHEALQNIIQRLQGLATAHSLLSAVNWTPLRLSELVQRIAQSTLRTIPRDQMVTLRVSPSDALVTPDQAHNLSLIINEIVMNTLRHALPERQSLHVHFAIDSDEETITLRYRDNGPGFGEAQLQQQVFNVGLELVHSLVRRSLKGEIRLSNDDGAVITITLPNEVSRSLSDKEP